MKELNVIRKELINSIDNASAEIYNVKNAFTQAYNMKFEEAKEFKQKNYKGKPKAQIISLANDYGITYQQACENIFASEQQMHRMIDRVEELRFMKIQVQQATTLADIERIAKPVLDELAQIYQTALTM